MVMWHGLQLALGGTVLGIAGALIVSPLLSSLLYATAPNDAVRYAGVLLLFLTVAVVACLVPPRQMTSIDVTVALRQE